MGKTYPLFLGGKAVSPNSDLAVTDKFTGKEFARVPLADSELIERAIALAERAAAPMRELPSYRRREILTHCVWRFEARAEELTQVLCAEAGKPLRDARAEVSRLIETFRAAAEESTRIYGQVLPLDISPRAVGYTGEWKRVPIGPCSFISPFNFPLNLVAHKVAPAIAAGCSFVLKPASFTPVSALILGEVLAETGLPDGAYSILPCHREGAELFTTDDRLRLLSFTGSPSVGWDLKARAGKKKVVLELGGNAAVVVDRDWDVSDAVSRVVSGGFSYSGQSCISVQRVFVHDAIYPQFQKQLVEGVRALKSGDPRDEKTAIGPLISEKEAQRLEKWIHDAVKAGGKLLTGGKRQGLMLEPAVLEDVPESQPLCAEEAFGPVVVLSRFQDFDKALAQVNQTRFGLQAGVFTRDLFHAQKAWDVLEVGGVVIGDAPTWRNDVMPYGGVKESGLGREGVRFAIEDMTEIRLRVIRNPTK